MDELTHYGGYRHVRACARDRRTIRGGTGGDRPSGCTVSLQYQLLQVSSYRWKRQSSTGMCSLVRAMGGSGGGAAGVLHPPPHPQRDPVISFLHMFSPKSARVGGRRPSPSNGSAPPQPEILDLPLTGNSFSGRL